MTGSFSALADLASPAIAIMCQDVTLPTNAGAITLSWVDRIRNFNPAFDTNQQFRVEIRDTNNAVLADGLFQPSRATRCSPTGRNGARAFPASPAGRCAWRSS